MKNYAILKSDVFLYGWLTHGRYYEKILELCEKGKLTLIYNDDILDDYRSISFNIMNQLDDEFFSEIEKIKKHGIKLSEDEILNLTNSKETKVFRVLPSLLPEEKGLKSKEGFIFIEDREIEKM